MFYFKNLETLLISQSVKEITIELVEGLVEKIDDAEKALNIMLFDNEIRIIKNGMLYEIFDKSYDCILEKDYEKFKLKNNLKAFNELNNIKPLTKSVKSEINNSEGPKLVRTSESTIYTFKSPGLR